MRLSEAKLAGRMLAYRPRAFRRASKPCSGRTLLLTPHFGPPIDPDRFHESRISRKGTILTHEDSVCFLAGSQGRIWKGDAMFVDGNASKVMDFELELDVFACC